MEKGLYREWVPMGAFVKGLVVLFSAFVVLISLLVSLSISNIQDMFGVAFGFSVLALILLIFWNYRGIEIQLSKTELYVKFGFFDRKSIKLENIVSCEIIKASFGRYLGIGIRYGVDGSLAYTTSFADAVKIVPSTGRTFVFSSRHTQEICDIINSTRNAN